jgi:diguanylate cyclase (GGDEF)-like protein
MDTQSLIARIAELEVENAQLKMRLATDYLTGAFNKDGFYAAALQQIKSNRRNGETSFVVFIDLDGLKKINDTFGHSHGCNSICEFARLTKSCLREIDILCRLGGDEFLLLISGNADVAMERLNHQIEKFNKQSGLPYQIGFSFGVSQADTCLCEKDLSDVIDIADKLMYEHKKRRKVQRAA